MSIRPMTTAEIQAALRRGAQVCVEQRRGDWHRIDVLLADGAYKAAEDVLRAGDGFCGTADHAATFLLLVAEAVE